MNEPTKKETKLKQLLDERGIKQKFLSDKLGFSAGAMSALVNGQRKMSLDEAVTIAKILGVEVEELL